MKKRTRHCESIDRMYMRYLYLLVFATAIAFVFAAYIFVTNTLAGNSETAYSKARNIEGGKHEASGVIGVKGTGGVLFIDDNQPSKIFWMLLDKDGNQTGSLKAIDLGVNIEDPEGITTDGNYFYIVGSQSRPKGVSQAGLVRFKFNPTSQTVEGAESITELKRFLTENVAELQGMNDVKTKDDGINIEGLAWDGTGKRLLLGFRSPVKDGQALIVALKLRDVSGPFSRENLDTKDVKTMRLPLGGQGVRSIEYDERSKMFNIIAGATETQEKIDFRLWAWGGEFGQSALRSVATFDRKLKPEGITRASVNGSQFTFVVCDTSRYLKID